MGEMSYRAMRNKIIGKEGEDIAAAEAVRRGYTILGRNIRTQFGEIDLLLESRDDGFIFVEVKTRYSLKYGLPSDAITRKKLQHMCNSALSYYNNHLAGENKPFRIDVITILKDARDPKFMDFHWYENITMDLL